MKYRMNSKLMKIVVVIGLTGLMLSAAAQKGNVINVNAAKITTEINPAMWGIFFEDINLGADGGLYAELVKNRSFEFPDAMTGWTKLSPSLAKGNLSIHDQDPFNAANPHYLRIQSEGTAPFGA